jgi:N-acyl-D-aspartate/D-glutamate deacylase
MQEEWIEKCVSHPMTQIASDGGWDDGDAHPRVAGSHARFLGRYVRDKQLLDLPLAIRKISLLPALSLQQAVPQMARKGRLQVGMDADIVVFDASTVIDKATYESPLSVPDGIDVVMVNGVVILQDGQFLENVRPGLAIRAATIE